jgi:hypothetical protein
VSNVLHETATTAIVEAIEKCRAAWRRDIEREPVLEEIRRAFAASVGGMGSKILVPEAVVPRRPDLREATLWGTAARETFDVQAALVRWRTTTFCTVQYRPAERDAADISVRFERDGLVLFADVDDFAGVQFDVLDQLMRERVLPDAIGRLGEVETVRLAFGGTYRAPVTWPAGALRPAPSAPKADDPQLPLAVGDTIRHAAFGTGSVVKILGPGPNGQVDVVFQLVGPKRLLRKFLAKT